MAISETRIKGVKWNNWEKELNALSSDDLIRFILKKSATQKREVEKSIEIDEREAQVLQSYSDLLNGIYEQPDSDDEDEYQEANRKKGQKAFQANEGKRKQIKVINKEIQDTKKKINDLRAPKQECINVKKEAQNHITKKVLSKARSQFKSNSDVAVKLLATFCGCLLGKQKATDDEVIEKLAVHEDLMSAMNRVDESKINRDHAKSYSDILAEFKHKVTEKENTKLIPFYVWLDNVFKLIKFAIDEKQHKKVIEQKENSVDNLNHDIEQNNIILDHLGYDPEQKEHADEVITFWDNHMEDVDTDMEKMKEKVENWNTDHVQDLSRKSKKLEEEKSFTLRRQYPVRGKKKQEQEEKKSAKKAAPAKTPAAKTSKGAKATKGQAKNSAKREPLPKAKDEESKQDASGNSNSSYEDSDDDKDNSGSSSGSASGSYSESGDNASVSESRDEESSA